MSGDPEVTDSCGKRASDGCWPEVPWPVFSQPAKSSSAGACSRRTAGGRPAAGPIAESRDVQRLSSAVKELRSASAAGLSATVLEEARTAAQGAREAVEAVVGSGTGVDPAAAGSWSELATALALLTPTVMELARQERVHMAARVSERGMANSEGSKPPDDASEAPAADADDEPDDDDGGGDGGSSDAAAACAAASAGAAPAPRHRPSASSPAAASGALAAVRRSASAPSPAADSGTPRLPGSPSRDGPRPARGAGATPLWQGLPGTGSRALGSMLGNTGSGAAGSGKPGIRVLCLDGGSVRGLASLQAVRALEASAGRPVAELFDLIVGTSIGGFLSVMLGGRRMSVERCEEALWEMHGAMERAQGTGVVSAAWRVAWGTAFSAEVHSEAIVSALGSTARMDELPSAPKVAAVATCIDRSPPRPFLLRSYELDAEGTARSSFGGSASLTQAEAVRATTAAPTFFPPALACGRLLVDGACLANNPATIALAEAAAIWPDAHIDAMVSIGTGLPSEAPHPGTSMVDWLTFQVNASMDCHLAHAIAGSMLGKGRYWRLNFPSVGDVALNETDPAVLRAMVERAKEHVHHPEFQKDLQDAAAVLTGRPTSEPPSPGAAEP